MEDKRKVIAFYKYVTIEDPVKFQQQHLDFCKSVGLLGRILVGKEGINGSVFGTMAQTEKYKNELRSNPLFADIEFKEHYTDKLAFRKMFVRLRNEIVFSGVDVDLKNTAEFIEPKELKELLDGKEDVVLVDMRNDYESMIGRFRNARTISMRNFRDLPGKMEEIEDLKHKKVITYCTGGIRCEKASAYLKESGFKDVRQLKGGILKYGEEFPDTHWEGKCFVFDDRLAVQLNREKTGPLAKCEWCKKECDDIMNCHNIECDRLFVCCHECRLAHSKSCSEICSTAPKRRKELQVCLAE